MMAKGETLEEFMDDPAKKAMSEAERREKRDGPDLKAPPEVLKRIKAAKTYVITSAINASPLDKKAWATLNVYAEHKGAEIIVVPIRYRNPTSPIETRKKLGHDDDWYWPEETQDYLVADRFKLHKGLWLIGDVKMQPTAVNPLSGMELFGAGASAIFPHPQLAYQTVATPSHRLPKMMATTGCITKPQYSESKAGAKAEEHHSIAALVVEIDGGCFHMRQLCFDSTGGCFDIDGDGVSYFHPQGVQTDQRAEALVLGDTHAWFMDSGVRKATFGSKGMCEVMRPKRVVHHDLLDSYSVSHHHRKTPFQNYGKFKAKKNLLLEELKHAVKLLEDTTPEDCELVIVGSNHHDHVQQFLNETDWRDDIANAETYLRLAYAVIQTCRFTKKGVTHADPFETFVAQTLDPKLLERTTFAGRSTYKVKGVELGLHGDAGPNGARGSAKNISKLGCKSIVGHSHSPKIEKGCWQVGVSTKELEYSRGKASSWLCTHAALWPNGKRSLITVVKGTRWRK